MRHPVAILLLAGLVFAAGPIGTGTTLAAGAQAPSRSAGFPDE